MNKNSNTIGDFISARKSLEQDRAQAVERIKEIDRVLGGTMPVSKSVIGKATPTKKQQAKPGGRRVMSDEAKQKIAAAQRKAWAARKAKTGKKGKSAKSAGQGSMSAAAKKKISDAMRKAWAKRKALKK